MSRSFMSRSVFYSPFLWLFVAEAFTQFGRIATNLGASDWDLKTPIKPSATGWLEFQVSKLDASDVQNSWRPPWLLMAGNSFPKWMFLIGWGRPRFPCEDCGFLDQSTGGLRLVVHNFWSILHRNPVLILEKITQDTVHGRNPKQPPGMCIKPCKEWDFNYLHLNWWVYRISDPSTLFRLPGHQGDGSSGDCLGWCGWWIVGGLQGWWRARIRYGRQGTCKGNNCHLWWRFLAGSYKIDTAFLVGGFKRAHFHLQTVQEDCPVDPVGIKLRFKWIGELVPFCNRKRKLCRDAIFRNHVEIFPKVRWGDMGAVEMDFKWIETMVSLVFQNPPVIRYHTLVVVGVLRVFKTPIFNRYLEDQRIYPPETNKSAWRINGWNMTCPFVWGTPPFFH